MKFSTSSFGRTLCLLEKSIGVNRLRSRVLANNLANVETPNFKRSHVNFEAELRRALSYEKNGELLMKFHKTDPAHFDYPKPTVWSDVNPRVVLDYLSTVKNNGNNVDFDRETSEVAKNGLTYNLMVEMLRFQFSQINMIVK